MLEVYAPRSKDEKRFKDKHIVVKSKLDDKGTQDDKLFKATNMKTVDRSPEHGYNPGDDESVYEAVHPMALHVKPVKVNGKTKFKVHQVGKDLEDGIKVGEHLSDTDLDDAEDMGAKIKHLNEKTLTPAEMKARERIAKGIEKSNPNMPMSKKMAIATASAKKVAEDVESTDEAVKVFYQAPGSRSMRFQKDSPAPGAQAHRDATAAAVKGLRAAGKIKSKELSQGGTDDIPTPQGGKIWAKNVKEETIEIEESNASHVVFQKNHEEAAKHIKGITKALSSHYDAVTNKKGYNKGEAGWHHVEQIKAINRQLSDLHDGILRGVDYNSPIKLKEDIDSDADLSDLLEIIYENLSDENKEVFEDILDNDPDQMVDFLEQLEIHYGR